MKYRGASQVICSGMAALLVTTSGCSSMHWFHSGSDEAAVSQSDQSRSDAEMAVAGKNRSGGYGAEERHRDGQYPSLNRQNNLSDEEGGALRGFSPLVNGRIHGEERLSRSSMGGMLLPMDQDEQWHAQIRLEEAAAREAGLKDVFYGYDRYSISDGDGMASLTSNAVWLKDNPNSLLKISGHCDERGSHDYNLVLGEKRAKAARSVLMDLGVNPQQVAIVSYGKDRPFCADQDETCYQQNRRGHMLLRK
jgi:peptidoglycan-associated lipoprotein